MLTINYVTGLLPILKLSLNVDKTFNKHRIYRWNIDILMDGKVIKQVSTTKFSGVPIDCILSWQDHITVVCNKVARCVDIISKLKHPRHQNILLTLYQTLILPHITYCWIIWSGTNKTNLNPPCIRQYKAIWRIVHAELCDHTSQLFKKLNVLKLHDVLKVNLATFMYKAWNGLRI